MDTQQNPNKPRKPTRLGSQALLLMKTLLIRGPMTAFLGLLVASVSAQTQSTVSSSTNYIETSKFIGKPVRSTQGDEIGTVKDIVLDRNTGCLAYTVLSTTAGGGTRVSGGGKMVAVPWAVYSPSSDLNVLTVNVDRERIYNAPVFDYARIDEYSRPEYISNVYSYYGVSPGAGVGVGVSTGTTTTGATTTTAAAQAGARASSGGATSSAATGSPAETASAGGTVAATPRATPSGRMHPTASPSTRGEERTSSPARKTRSERGRSEESSPPSGRGENGSRSEAERSQPEQSQQAKSDSGARESGSETGQPQPEGAAQGQKQTGTRQHEKTGKRKTKSPSELPDGE